MPAATSEPPRRSCTWVTASSGLYYRAASGGTDKKKRNAKAVRFPRPLIEPRRSRPHAIHIITYPPGYVPHELRPKPESSRARKIKVRAARAKRRINDARGDAREPAAPSEPSATATPLGPERRSDRYPIRPVLGKLLDSLSISNSSQSSNNSSNANKTSLLPSRRHSSFVSSPAAASCAPAAAATPSATATWASTGVSSPECDVIRQVPESLYRQSATNRSDPVLAHARTATNSSTTPTTPTSTSPPATAATAVAGASGASSSSSDYQTNPSFASNAHQPLVRAATDTGVASSRPRSHVRTHSSKRNSLMSIRTTTKSAISSLVTEVPKPVASGSGVSCSIILAEPHIFLSGFDHDGHASRGGHGGTALLRGRMQLNVSKNVKIKAVQLKLIGRARTEWPEGIPPLKQDVFEELGLRTQVLTFFNAMNDGWETEYGNQCTYKLKKSPETDSGNNTYLMVSPSPANPQRNLTPKDIKRLSLQNTQSRSFTKGELGYSIPTQAKGFKIFYPGTYDYSFELPIDHHQLETIKLHYGSVRWDLHATVNRAGAFKPNLHGAKEVSIVRVPDQMSLEMSEPISISRQWEDQLHYDIIISGKSFPIGSKIPIAFKLTPLAKVQVHKLKVFVTESIEYWTNDRRVTRKDPGRKILLLEKSAGKPLDKNWASSDLRTVRGGELTTDQRRHARDLASRRRHNDAARRQASPQPLPEPSDNLLGDLDLGLESYWGSTEIEANVQIPTCETMAKNKDLRLHPDCSWKNVNVYHWIKIVMRISRADPEDPAKRRHFEISIDSPFTVLNCRATQANTVLPAYTGNQHQCQMYQSSCGCPDAVTVPAETSPNSSTGTLSGMDRSTESLPAMPQAAHLAHSASNPASEHQMVVEPRPIHLLRVPSFNPPAFDEDTAPPPLSIITQNDHVDSNSESLTTPPPQYDVVVGTPSVDGLADYFSRLADYGYDHHDDEDSGSDSDQSPPRLLERSGRVNVAHPHTPGGRMPSRSMEIPRPTITLNMDTLTSRAAQTQAAN